jgi:hypothetical protein
MHSGFFKMIKEILGRIAWILIIIGSVALVALAVSMLFDFVL